MGGVVGEGGGAAPGCSVFLAVTELDLDDHWNIILSPCVCVCVCQICDLVEFPSYCSSPKVHACVFVCV